jgi:Dyp-type peroxidase family
MTEPRPTPADVTPAGLAASRLSPKIHRAEQEKKAGQLAEEKVVQPGIGFPSPAVQEHLLIVRLNLAPPEVGSPAGAEAVRRGLKTLCTLLDRIESGRKRIDVLEDGRPRPTPLSHFSWSATVGFGQGFFDRLGIPPERRPARLSGMPDHVGLGDTIPYSLGQTDMILQLGSSNSFVNRWVLENTLEPAAGEDVKDIVSAVAGWATITDVHSGFQRTDGRNLQGFNDGVSNPRALSPLFDEVVWSTDEPDPALRRGTYMVFQKIIHDLDQWRELEVDEQQEWVGRSKGTGLLLGTLDDEEDDKLANGLRAGDDEAFKQWKKLFDLESHPEITFFDPGELPKETKDLPEDVRANFTIEQVRAICERTAQRVPAWSHVRKVNPRRTDGTPQKIIFRRGYPFMDRGMDNKIVAGLLFVSFQKDIQGTFEFIKKRWAGNPNFPVGAPGTTPAEGNLRPFNDTESALRHQSGRFTVAELHALTPEEKKLLGLACPMSFNQALASAAEANRQQTGREGLAGPSENGVTPTGEFLAIVPLGGGYYFVPPIPGKKTAEIGQQFFGSGEPTGSA